MSSPTVALYLRHGGYDVTTAGTGREALEEIGRAMPDLLVLDLMLPEVKGLEVCRVLRQRSQVPVIMLTARSTVHDTLDGPQSAPEARVEGHAVCKRGHDSADTAMGATLLFRRLANVSIPVLALCCVGFGPQRDWTDNLAWSPDGRRAAVLVAGGLYVSDTQGNLSPLLASDVYRVAWLGDSERLVFARTRRVSTFADISAALTPERTRKVVASAEHLLMHIQSPDWSSNVERGGREHVFVGGSLYSRNCRQSHRTGAMRRPSHGCGWRGCLGFR